MLSILIPTYNYNAFSLVEELNNQALATGIKYEIIVLDDGSNYFLKENQKINELDNCSLNELSQNIGYSKIRNVLAKKAKYDWLLFLDSDTFPRSSSYISNYIKLITKNKKVVFGGIEYPKNKPENDKLLRWNMVKKREVSSLSNRIKKPYNSVLFIIF
ncbi:glycosyl transferase [Flavobacterium psychrophilum]|uniref:glycosyltransferase family 2 protein n=1 Tax=Flavobacterium psychrophilum TaxID=96345 RepID=UPI00073F1239|nr:glycosyltransferase [Flavobacterium psychrophilum]GAQ49743.1 glycosyl transferase [Flavobacterium psychrophilum]